MKEEDESVRESKPGIGEKPVLLLLVGFRCKYVESLQNHFSFIFILQCKWLTVPMAAVMHVCCNVHEMLFQQKHEM